MNKCTDSAMNEMLPDLLHRTLTADAKARVEAHLATCEECREDVAVLRTIVSAAVFAPTIDVDSVVRQIPPYQQIAPTVGLPARPRLVSWLVAASLAITVLGVGSVLATREKGTVAPAAVASSPSSVQTPPRAMPVVTGAPEPTRPGTVAASGQPHAHQLALAADVDGLSDGNLVQLMSEMTRFDALPATEVDPVISVDSGDNVEQDLR